LKNQPEKYTLVDNRRVNTVKPSPCWTRFALPAVKDENHQNIIIEKFATCRSCYISAGVVISQRRTNISPSTVNDIILIRSSTNRSKKTYKLNLFFFS
jgi:hypothetical protein